MVISTQHLMPIPESSEQAQQIDAVEQLRGKPNFVENWLKFKFFQDLRRANLTYSLQVAPTMLIQPQTILKLCPSIRLMSTKKARFLKCSLLRKFRAPQPNPHLLHHCILAVTPLMFHLRPANYHWMSPSSTALERLGEMKRSANTCKQSSLSVALL